MAAALARFFDSDVWWSFKRSPITVASAIVAAICIIGAALAPFLAPRGSDYRGGNQFFKRQGEQGRNIACRDTHGGRKQQAQCGKRTEGKRSAKKVLHRGAPVSDWSKSITRLGAICRSC